METLDSLHYNYGRRREGGRTVKWEEALTASLKTSSTLRAYAAEGENALLQAVL